MAEETPIAFVARWTDSLRSLQSTAAAHASPPSPGALAALSTEAQLLGAQLTEQAESIPAYELERCKRELKGVLESIAALKSNAAGGKAKFAFKRSAGAAAAGASKASPSSLSRASSSTSTSTSVTASLPPPARPAPTPPTVPATSLTLSSRSDAYLTCADLPARVSGSTTDDHGEALLLSDLVECFVGLTSREAEGQADQHRGGGFSALYLYNLRRCVVLVEPDIMQGSAMLHACEGCLIVLGCHQFRMHDSNDCTLLLQVGSTPIIERCRSLRFGAYPSWLATSSSPLPSSSFASVQDFDHPFASAANPSLNFRVLPGEGAGSEGGILLDDKWRTAQGRREGWRELLGAVAPRDGERKQKVEA